ncbi:hypothetical protein [Staphylococcus delphini]|uniref:hypothetical protein n=1 Tax=Staphylococcus delphini TaxID=53344 RepID=UPI0021D06545|nr:hypothetical protein [Staphylococcus delphini]UXS43777.1 hypothetical protein MUA39_10490 [Staphylococcus delphini]UXV46311.1 hypothetical protein MUA63_13595 [Staphylococcus delphini]
MENEKMLITIERYDQLIGERAVYKSEAQRLEDENIELKGRIKDLEKSLSIGTLVSVLVDDGEEELLDD